MPPKLKLIRIIVLIVPKIQERGVSNAVKAKPAGDQPNPQSPIPNGLR